MKNLTVRGVLLGFVLTALAANSAAAGPANPPAQGEADALQGPGGGTVSAELTVGEAGVGGPGASVGGGTSSSSGLVTVGWRGPLPGSGCPGLGAEAPGVEAPRNELYEYVREDRTTVPPTTTVLRRSCFPPELAPRTLPPPPPPPPTLAEITQVVRAEILVPDVKVNPSAEGVTGLETWLWYEGQQEVTVSTGIRGYRVTATMRPTRFYWDTGDGGALRESSVPGSETAPAATWIYDTKAPYRVRLQVVWDGTWSFSGPGGTARGSLSTIRATGGRDYPVVEIRSVLVE